MESYKIENLSFTYPKSANKALDNICISINRGEFITVCGKSGCGKTTLLRLLESSLSPYGELSGNIYFEGTLLSELNLKEQTSKIGFVLQSPDNQIVTDKVWHELAFGLESLGYSTPEIRTRVSEMASYFGIENWFHKNVAELSGGQKQLLNLASIMVMQPSVLILDEPTSQLDPIAAQDFLKTLEKINRELGTTVILTEHRLENTIPISDRVIVMDNGEIIADTTPEKVGRILKLLNHDMYLALPAPMRIYGEVENNFYCPLTVREGRDWLEKYAQNNPLDLSIISEVVDNNQQLKTVIELKDAWFRYEKDSPDVIKGLNIKIGEGEIFAIVGGNGTGKTTALSLISGLNPPYRGEVLIKGERICRINNLYDGILGVLPQNPQTLFVKKTVYLDLLEILSERKISKAEKESEIRNIASLCRIEDLLESHPYDLSGGEQQRVALAKILLKSSEIILLDEPTKGMDAQFKKVFADILENLKSNGITVVMVSHDIEFCAEYADRCAMFFDGNITSSGVPREFFAGKSFYTTSANRMARNLIPNAILADDIILACGGKVKKTQSIKATEVALPHTCAKNENVIPKSRKLTLKKIVLGSIFGLLFILTCLLQLSIKTLNTTEIQLITIFEISLCLLCFLPKKEFFIENIHQPVNLRKMNSRTLWSMLFILIAIPLTIFIGMYYFGDRKYYFISLCIILETLIPFFIAFEGKKPQARELLVISVLCALGVAGRTAFFMFPQFKPVLAIVIVAGVCFGGETGFLVGAITGFVSNFFFGQGPWTQWQMFAYGIIGFIAGVLFQKGLVRKTKVSLSAFGAFATFFIHGGIMNPASVIMWQANPTAEMFVYSFLMGFPFDLIHAVSTSFFLWFISEPMIDKLERIKTKYGLIREKIN